MRLIWLTDDWIIAFFYWNYCNQFVYIWSLNWLSESNQLSIKTRKAFWGMKWVQRSPSCLTFAWRMVHSEWVKHNQMITVERNIMNTKKAYWQISEQFVSNMNHRTKRSLYIRKIGWGKFGQAKRRPVNL